MPKLPPPRTYQQDVNHLIDLVRRAKPAPDHLPDSRGLTSTEKVVAINIAIDGSYGDGWCFSSETRLALFSSVDPATVRRAITNMIAKGWLAQRQQAVPRHLAASKRWVRLTPVMGDVMPDDYVADQIDHANAATAERKRKSRAKQASCANSPHPNVTTPCCDVTTPCRDCHNTVRAEYRRDQHQRSVPTTPPVTSSPDADAAAVGDCSDGAVPPTTPIVAPTPRDNAALMVSVAPTVPDTVVWDGVPVPGRITASAHATLEPVIDRAMQHWLAHLRRGPSGSRSWALSMLASEYGMGQVAVVAAIRRVANQSGGLTTVDQLVSAVSRSVAIHPKTREYIVRTLQKWGLYRDAIADHTEPGT